MEKSMDRRQRKTRQAIFEAFTQLLQEKNIQQITVGEIIQRADVGRATFYAHFETKDYLLKAFCEDLFCHIFDSVDGAEGEHHHLFTCDTPTPVFLHLLQHLKKNDHQILQLLSCRHNDVFLRYFKEGVQRLAVREIDAAATVSPLPRDFHLNHIAATFAETVRWWVECDGLSTEPEIIYQHFLTAAQIHDAKEAGQ